MKILIDGRMYGLEHSGIGRYLVNLIDNLQQIDKKNNYVVLLRKKYFDALNFSKNWKKVLADFRHYTVKEQLRLPGLINKEKTDLVHFPHINYPIFFKGKHIITVHDLTMQRQGTDSTSLPLPIYYLKRVPFLFAAMVGIKRASAVIVPSKTAKKDVVNHYNVEEKKVFVTYEGFFNNFRQKTERPGENEILSKHNLESDKYFFYVGNAYPHKNLSVVIKAVFLLNKELGTNLRFAIAGSKNIFFDRIKRSAKSSDAEKFIKFLGYVPDNELQVLYKNSAAFVYPSLSEGFGLQGLEAMSSESLVLASDIPVFKEIYEDNVIYFDPKDTNSLVELMKSVMKMTHSEKLARVNKAKEFISKYSWRKMAKQTLNVYQKVLKNES